MHTSLADAIEHLPVLLSKEDRDNLPALLGKLSSLMANYAAQSAAVELLTFVQGSKGPAFGFDLGIDQEDGTYYLYYGGSEGVEVDEDDFDTLDDMEDFCTSKAEDLEAFAQRLNDAPWREDHCTIFMVDELNSVRWRKDEAQDAIARGLDRGGVDGGVFIGAWKASEQAEALQQATPRPASTAGRRGL